MPRTTTFAVLAVLAAGAVWAGAELTRPPHDGLAGIAYAEAFDTRREREIGFHIWYPAEPGGHRVTVGGNGVFHGTPAGRGAPHADGVHRSS